MRTFGLAHGTANLSKERVAVQRRREIKDIAARSDGGLVLSQEGGNFFLQLLLVVSPEIQKKRGEGERKRQD
jgi:hypothetical protein